MLCASALIYGRVRLVVNRKRSIQSSLLIAVRQQLYSCWIMNRPLDEFPGSSIQVAHVIVGGSM
jgi:hypothetical protein